MRGVTDSVRCDPQPQTQLRARAELNLRFIRTATVDPPRLEHSDAILVGEWAPSLDRGIPDEWLRRLEKPLTATIHGHMLIVMKARVPRDPARSMAAGVFKSRCLQVMDEVRARRIDVVITKRGKPVAKLVPASEEPRDIFGCMQGTGELRGDITQPVISSEEWEDSDYVIGDFA